ncbi:MAG: glycosyltransferase [Candidatus Competibacteraceae bacterium]|nr:glycosyltransferase [Candidatus Competibacteraceae bacterium]
MPNLDFSVCVPTFNRAHLLPKLFQGLDEQRGPSFELVIVNDGSTDNTSDTVRRLIQPLGSRYSISIYNMVAAGEP